MNFQKVQSHWRKKHTNKQPKHHPQLQDQEQQALQQQLSFIITHTAIREAPSTVKAAPAAATKPSFEVKSIKNILPQIVGRKP